VKAKRFFSSPFSFLCDLFFCAQRVEREHRECFPLRFGAEKERGSVKSVKDREWRRERCFFFFEKVEVEFFSFFFCFIFSFAAAAARLCPAPVYSSACCCCASRGHWAEATLSLGWFSREEGGGKQQKEGERGSRLSHFLPLSSSSPTPFFPSSLLPFFPPSRARGQKKIRGEQGRARTCDLPIRSRTLYPTELHVQSTGLSC
jgi:hypothetical protein